MIATENPFSRGRVKSAALRDFRRGNRKAGGDELVGKGLAGYAGRLPVEGKMAKTPLSFNWLKQALRPLLLLAALAPTVPTAAEPDFLPPQQAFRHGATASASAITVEWNVTPGYYLYRKRMGFESTTPGITLGTAEFPKGEDHEDEFFGRQEVYRGAGNRFVVPYQRAAGTTGPLQLVLKLQGCADAGLCYPPQRWTVDVALPTAAPAAGPAAPGAAGGGVRDLAALARSRPAAGGDFLPPTQAFQLTATAVAADRIQVAFAITPGYYLYQKRLKASLEGAVPTGTRLLPPDWPPGQDHEDEFFGRQVVYPDSFTTELRLARPAQAGALSLQLAIGLQGCAYAGLCYPPETRTLTVALPAMGSSPAVLAGTTAASPPGTAATSGDPAPAMTGATASPAGANGMVSEQDRLAGLVASGSLGLVLASFFGFGLLLAFTPCVLPMIPILSGIIAGDGPAVTPARGFLLSLSYVLGMALTYTVAGIAFAAAGQQAQAVFQQPWILALFSLLFVALAAAMFGFYELQLPSSLQTRLASASGRFAGGRFVSTAVMGALSSLVVTACVAPPLVAALAVISQTGDVLRGGLALFALSIGMGAPLLVVGASAGRLLPRAGVWMETVKQVFGVMFLGVAVWMAERILAPGVVLALWALVAASAVWVVWPRDGWRPFGATAALRSVVVGTAILWGGLLLVGAAAGGEDPLNPLQGTRFGAEAPRGVVFKPIRSVAELDRELAAAQAAGRRVMVDFSAEWCVSCKEMEKYTFRDSGVQAALAPYVLLQADVTANNDNDRALLARFGIFGPPTTAFFGLDGVERREFRLVGFVAAEPFRQHIARLESTP